MAKKKKVKKYTVDIEVTTDLVIYASSKSEARKLAWDKFKKRPGKHHVKIDPHFYHRY